MPKSNQEKNAIKRRHSAPSSINANALIGHFKDAPPFLQDNQHIFKGYRIGYDSVTKILKTIFMVHNQTVNIWTHLIGAIIVFFIIFEGIAYEMEESHVLGKALIKDTVLQYQSNNTHLLDIEADLLCEMMNAELPNGQTPYQCQNQLVSKSPKFQPVFDNAVPTWPIMVALFGGAVCLACSAVFHLMHPISEKTYKIMLGLDFAGIGMNMAFSPVPAFYYAMYCQRYTAMAYILIISISGTLSFLVSLSDWLHKRQNFLFKAIILSFSATVSAFGLVHIIVNQFIYNNYGDGFTITPSLFFFIPTLLTYLLGFVIYGSRCPQRYHPGKFDICGHSHQLWHVCVFIAIILTYLGSLACYQIRSQWATCPSGYLQHFP